MGASFLNVPTNAATVKSTPAFALLSKHPHAQTKVMAPTLQAHSHRRDARDSRVQCQKQTQSISMNVPIEILHHILSQLSLLDLLLARGVNRLFRFICLEHICNKYVRSSWIKIRLDGLFGYSPISNGMPEKLSFKPAEDWQMLKWSGQGSEQLMYMRSCRQGYITFIIGKTITEFPIFLQRTKKDGKFVWDIGPDIERYNIPERRHYSNKKKYPLIKYHDGPPRVVLAYCPESRVWEVCVPFCRLLAIMKLGYGKLWVD
jgi:hypothetical protein